MILYDNRMYNLRINDAPLSHRINVLRLSALSPLLTMLPPPAYMAQIYQFCHRY